jgi:NADPH:quinone reductase-like Zn-dependent oxidoreductase
MFFNIKRGKMKAVINNEYGDPDVLRIAEIEKPVVNEDELLIKIHYTTATTVDSTFRKGDSFFARLFTGAFKPKKNVLGGEFSGVVEETGKSVTSFKKGDKVWGGAPDGFGAYAEYIKVNRNDAVSLIPDGVSFDFAAASYGALTALPFLRDEGKIEKGMQVLINGASGSIGSFAVQLAKFYDCEVTALCSPRNFELVKSLGADYAFDYSSPEISGQLKKYDIIFDAVGKTSFGKTKRYLKKNGRYLTTVVTPAILWQKLFTRFIGGKKAIIAFTGLRSANEKLRDMDFVNKLMSIGKLKPLIDREYDIQQIRAAHGYVDKGHKRGNVVIKLI